MAYSGGSADYFVPREPWIQRPRPIALRNDSRGLYQYNTLLEGNLTYFRRKQPYSFWSSCKYIFILSLMLWWIPTFGQMIAGYVGGRKAGNHWKAAGAALFPVAIIWILSLMARASDTFPALANLLTLPATAAYGLGQALPFLDPTVRFIVDYVTSFIVALRETVSMGLNGYLVTIIFAYIGGLIALQTSQERAAHSEEEAFGREALPPFEPQYPLLPPPRPRARVSFSAGPGGWYTGHSERYDHLRRIPMAPYAYQEEPFGYYEPPRRPVQRRLEEVYDLDEGYPSEPDMEAVRQPQRRRRLQRLDKEELIRRLVERALREYDRSVR